jgi:hypothetical protein
MGWLSKDMLFEAARTQTTKFAYEITAVGLIGPLLSTATKYRGQRAR